MEGGYVVVVYLSARGGDAIKPNGTASLEDPFVQWGRRAEFRTHEQAAGGMSAVGTHSVLNGLNAAISWGVNSDIRS